MSLERIKPSDATGAPLSRALKKLKTPRQIQDYLDALAYRAESVYCSPLDVVRDRKANCFDGALFAACALENLGFPAQILDLRAVRDDDHVLAVFRAGRLWGALGKSNYVGLRYREPVYASIRELVMSYFEFYFNVHGEKTLREYSHPMSLRSFDSRTWRISRDGLQDIADALDRKPHFPVFPPSAGRSLSRVDRRSLRAGLYGSNPKGLNRSYG